MTATLISTLNEPLPRTSDYDRFLEESALLTLKACGYSELTRIGCRVDDGTVELMGSVPSFFLKQMAQTLVLRLDVKGVRNDIQVSIT